MRTTDTTETTETTGNPEAIAENAYVRSRRALQTWGQLSVHTRVKFLKQLRLVIVQNREAIASAISSATGKPQFEAMATEILVVAESIRFTEKHAERALKPKKVKTPMTLFGKSSYIEYKPWGVVLVIAPWNFPFQLTMIPVIEALAAGNTVIVKPSEVTPLVSASMRQLFIDAGFPQDVVQVVEGGPELGRALVDERPDYIHFTGSVHTGRQIQLVAAQNLIPTTLELGGKDPMIVFRDANLERAVQGAIWGGFANCGQVCMSVERLYVEKSIYEVFVRRLVEETRKLTHGAALSDIGPMTTLAQVRSVYSHVQDAIQSGATLTHGATPAEWDSGTKSVVPTILTNVSHEMDIMQEETFGPILPILPFDCEEEAIRLANDTRFGLSASVWTADIARGKRVASRLQSGNVVINDVLITIANPYLPYGGVKEGGIGRYHSTIGLRAFSLQTSVMVDRGKRIREVMWFPYRGKFGPMSSLVENRFGSRVRFGKVVAAFRDLLRKSRG